MVRKPAPLLDSKVRSRCKGAFWIHRKCALGTSKVRYKFIKCVLDTGFSPTVDNFVDKSVEKYSFVRFFIGFTGVKCVHVPITHLTKNIFVCITHFSIDLCTLYALCRRTTCI